LQRCYNWIKKINGCGIKIHSIENIEPINCDSQFIFATGLGGTDREYLSYSKKFGENNTTIIKWDETCTDIDSHIRKVKDNLPSDKPFVFCGLSLGGALAIELLSREIIPNLQGVILIGSSRKIKQDGGLNFIMKFPWFFLWIFSFILVLLFPITIFIWGKKTFDTYRDLFDFLRRDGAKKIHKQYNLCLKKLGDAEKILQPEIPILYVGLPKDALVDEKDLEFTLKLFANSKKHLIDVNSIHLMEKYDPLIVEKIAEEAEFIGLIKS
jgi:pimeloyl-ACP methyl ester carboxylesterase